ncbi:class I SAM-dependent methyltransferase [Cellulophaga baltica]|uniref:class I SAM-dependent methyltransferase n=1 Tax=Cellulophaga TaxID=104264 RepID=UPI001C07DF1E|nr:MULTISPECIES: class I SAM-dependent methyltransferase [Cellulophaga]MBU2997910.1 class I SAM-dependent methyltransferase [Cellulophaga baltica]MDO6769311.1 class I SAM-dependent methyltransferase [Cellulophaga sp. 1_MG-2023]
MAKEEAKKWDDRYREKEYAYGIKPNVFFKKEIEKLNISKILFGAEGEGRNAVFTKTLGHDVVAFDISHEAKKKALKLAEQNGVTLDYKVGELPNLGFKPKSFDVIALIYAHFPSIIRQEYHKMLDTLLKPGGYIIFEAFSKNHLKYKMENPKVGGPGDLDVLFSIDELKSDFKNYNIIQLEEKTIELDEGIYHIGQGSVIRFIAKKQ